MKKFNIQLIKIAKILISEYTGYFKFIKSTIDQFKIQFSKIKNNVGNFDVHFKDYIIHINIFNSDIQQTKYDCGIADTYYKNGQYYIDIYGCNELDYDWYENTFEHELMHLCQLYFGYATKQQMKSWNKDKNQDYMYNFNEQVKIPFNQKLEAYYTDIDQFSQYLADSIRFFLSLIKNGIYSKQQVQNILKSNIWNDKRKLLKFIHIPNIDSVQSIYFMYFWYRKDRNKFIKIINKILKFI